MEPGAGCKAAGGTEKLRHAQKGQGAVPEAEDSHWPPQGWAPQAEHARCLWLGIAQFPKEFADGGMGMRQGLWDP